MAGYGGSDVSVSVAVRQPDTGDEVQVVVPSNATIKDLKAAVSEKLAKPEVAKKGRAMSYAEGGASGYKALRDTELLGDRRVVLIRNADLSANVEDDSSLKGDFSEPVLVCFYSGGVSPKKGRELLKDWFDAAAGAGLKDTIVMDFPQAPEFEDCENWAAYTARMVEIIDKDPKHHGRPVVIFSHSHGTIPAYGLAQRLGSRLRKLYVICGRGPQWPMDDIWGNRSAAELVDVTDVELLRGLITAWKNEFLDMFKDHEELPAGVKDTMVTVREVYCDARTPCFSADIKESIGEPPQVISAPIFAIASKSELPKGETEMKMESWRELTTGGFKLRSIDADHFDMIKTIDGKCVAFDAVLQDMKPFLPQ